MTQPERNLNQLKRLLGSGDPLPAEYLEFVAQDPEAKRVSDGFARLDALLQSEPEPPEVDVTQGVMARIVRQERVSRWSLLALAASVALVVGVSATFFAPAPVESLGTLVADPLAVETGYTRPELPLAPLLDTPSDWLEGVTAELRAAVPSDSLPQTPMALILLLAPLLGVLNWFVSRKEQIAGGIA